MLEFQTFSESLFGLPMREPDSLFITSRDEQLTYAAFAARVANAVRVLGGMFDRRQTPVFVVSNNSADFIVSLYALNYLGQVVVPLFDGHASEEFRALYRAYEPSLVIADERCQRVFSSLGANLSSFEDLASPQPGVLPPVTHSRDDACFILLTSGARSMAKGVVLTNGNILSDLAGIQHYMKVSETDRCLIIRSLTHASALVGELLLTGLTAGRCVLRGTPNTIRQLFEWCHAEAITWMGVTPALLKAMVDYGRLHSREINLRRVVNVGARLPGELCRAFLATFPCTELINAYGLTEASPRVAYLPPALASVKPGAVGYPIKGCRIRVTNKQGKECAPGEVGEIEVAGANVMRGYFPEGLYHPCRKPTDWLSTGDEGHLDPDGVLFVHGRLDTMVVRNGLNIHPEYVNSVLERCADVGQAVVTNVEDERPGGRLLAFVELRSGVTERDAIGRIRKHLSEYLDIRKHPDEIIFVPNLPLTPSGKVAVKILVKERSSQR